MELVHQLVKLYDHGKFKDVIDEARILAKKYPDEFIIWNILGAAYKNLGRIENAFEAFNKVVKLNPYFVHGFNNLGTVLKEQGRLNEAVDAFKKALLLKPDCAETLIEIGNILQDMDKLEEAIEAYTKSISFNSKHPETYINMGIVLKKQGKLDEAIDTINKVILLKPDYADAYFNLGILFQDRGRLEEAIVAYKKVLKLNPTYIKAHINLGNLFQDIGKIDEAIEEYKKAIKFKFGYAEAYCNMGVALKAQGKLHQAIRSIKKALKLKPDYFDAYINIGSILQDQGKNHEAIKAYKKAIFLKPDSADIICNIGVLLKKQGKFEKAIKTFNKVLSLEPNYGEAYNNIGNVLQEQGKTKEAILSFKKSISLNPDCADAYSNMGISLKDQGKSEEAIQAFKKALFLKSDHAETHVNLSLILLNCGKIKEGLNEYEWRWKTAKGLSRQRHFLKPLWDGKKSLKGKKILIWYEQGIGDTINWSSYLSFIIPLAEQCILECQKKLVPLLKDSFPRIEVRSENRLFDLEREDFDYHLPMGNLYKHFKPKNSNAIKIEPFLVPDPDRVKYWTKRLKSIGVGPFIGISWKSSNLVSNRLQNYSSLVQWAPIFKIPNVTFINLQSNDFKSDLANIQNKFGIKVHNFDDLDHFNKLSDVAALISALDFVVSIKTTVPLISAGVGTPTKLANWKQSTWNNELFNPTSSSVDIFERNTWEPWSDVFNLIAENILKEIKTRSLK